MRGLRFYEMMQQFIFRFSSVRQIMLFLIRAYAISDFLDFEGSQTKSCYQSDLNDTEFLLL